ncbi:CheW-like domain-containing protein [Butyrivibrio proteoclasticus]|uniref:histidine kinase n=1 Tax=Butyrivibrio proteoclasticus TaxID=43305 RepID=A0A1I5U1F0_9FIRM|nr:chemotaxis protein CheW [Butyrivibrio proteoclasticus]SFP89120.1 CheW-like domain-containing protein [Butyrivibrio proteoclasticus]
MELSQCVAAKLESSQALIAGVRDEKIAIPLSAVLSIENVAVSEIKSVNFEDVIYLRGQVIPLIYMDKLFDCEDSNTESSNINVVICMYKDTYIGLVVDELFGQDDINTKSLGILDNNNRFFSGATILDDAVALILDVESLIA